MRKIFLLYRIINYIFYEIVSTRMVKFKKIKFLTLNVSKVRQTLFWGKYSWKNLIHFCFIFRSMNLSIFFWIKISYLYSMIVGILGIIYIYFVGIPQEIFAAGVYLVFAAIMFIMSFSNSSEFYTVMMILNVNLTFILKMIISLLLY